MLKKYKKYKKRNEGFTLVEVLFAVSLVAFSLIAILNMFIYQARQNTSVNDRNIAIVLAEERMERLFKFPANDMPNYGTTTEYVVYKENRQRDNTVYTSASQAVSAGNAFKITERVTKGMFTSNLLVRVNFGKNFFFHVELETEKGR
jgi:Tfp pilus assembly protein PilV